MRPQGVVSGIRAGRSAIYTCFPPSCMLRIARIVIPQPTRSPLEWPCSRVYYSTRRPRRVEPRAQDLSARFQQLERTLRTKETLADQLADSHHVQSSTDAESPEDISPRRTVKPVRTFHGLIIPDKPSEPQADGALHCFNLLL